MDHMLRNHERMLMQAVTCERLKLLRELWEQSKENPIDHVNLESMLLKEQRKSLNLVNLRGRVKVGHPLEGSKFKVLGIHGEFLQVEIDGVEHQVNHKDTQLEMYLEGDNPTT